MSWSSGRTTSTATRSRRGTRPWSWSRRSLWRGHSRPEVSDLPDQKGKRRRLRPARELLDLGRRLMGDAEADVTGRAVDRALAYRNGLAIAALALRPLRCKNFAELIVGRHLRPIGSGWWLIVPGLEAKTGQPMEMHWPDVLVAPLERYLDHWRQILASGADDPADVRAGWLWLSVYGRRLSPHTLALRISAITKECFGAAVNMHLFRDALATDIAINDPEHVASAAALLGHRQLATTERFYNLARSVEAAADYHRALKRLR